MTYVKKETQSNKEWVAKLVSEIEVEEAQNLENAISEKLHNFE